MEVHHHSHTSRKKWTHYFWEFLMLFLAVFCGFLAEYQLEHKIEKDRELQYMEGMVDDLIADTIELNNRIWFNTNLSNGLDSLQNNLYNTDSAVQNTLILYRQNATYIRILPVEFNDQTATQLRNSGTMRLIRKKEVAKAISEYWNKSNGIMDIVAGMEDRVNEIYTVSHSIFNRKHQLNFSRDSVSRMSMGVIDPAARLMTTDAKILINYANYLYRYNSNIDRFLNPNLIRQKQRAINMITQIKKEYHLK